MITDEMLNKEVNPTLYLIEFYFNPQKLNRGNKIEHIITKS